MKTLTLSVVIAVFFIGCKATCQVSSTQNEMGLYILDTIKINTPYVVILNDSSNRTIGVLIDSLHLHLFNVSDEKSIYKNGYLFLDQCSSYKNIEELLYQKKVEHKLIPTYQNIVKQLKKSCDSDSFYSENGEKGRVLLRKIKTNKFLFYIIQGKYLKTRLSDHDIHYYDVDNLYFKVLAPIR